MNIGIALGSGGTKGFAHIEYLKVIDEFGIRIGAISGSSMGALIGAFYAGGMKAAEMEKVFADLTLFDKAKMADGLILLAYYLFVLVMRENSYASRVVEVAAEQKVIKTGPYAVVRHPLYVSAILIWVLTPLALGSLWAFMLALLFPFLLIVRIKNEEKVLTEELPGYREYLQEVKYRLVPGIW
ncbi:MAG: patatin-like phospholipase family protein [Candidatus Neomarinimicrobiota bacterium]